MKQQKIEWIAKDVATHHLIPHPKPNRSYLPDWYKALPTSGKNLELEHGFKVNREVKDCMPFIDALTCGYVQESWVDVHFVFDKDKDGNPTYIWNLPIQTPMIKDARNPPSNTPVPAGFHPFEFLTEMIWLPRTPKGWSTLISPVMNRYDLPWQGMYGIVDSDEFFHWHGNIPIFVKDTGKKEVLIPAGTPMYQMTPFYRANWKSFIAEQFDELGLQKRTWEYIKSYGPLYLRKMWKKKKYE